IPFTGEVRVTELKDGAAVFGDREVPFSVDLATFYEKEDALKKGYVKIDNPGGAEELRKGEVVPKDVYEKARTTPLDRKETEPTFKPPETVTKTEIRPALTFLPDVKYTLPILLAALAIWLGWRVVNVPSFADFLIATEAELNKVSWTSRRRLIQDTIVVLVTVLLFTIFLFVVDVAWGWILSSKPVGVLKINEGGGKVDEKLQQNW